MVSRIEYHPMIRDMPTAERPRERLLQSGAGALSNAELLAILLRTGVAGESALDMGHRLLSRFSGLQGIAGATLAELSEHRGISEVKYCQLAAALELGRRMASLSPEDRAVVRSPRDVANLLMAEMAALPQEHMRILLLNTRNQLLGVHPLYVGTVNTALVRTAEVFRRAIRDNSPAIILVHNHPSGDPSPSPQDIKLTGDLCAAAKLLDVELVDHIIIGQNGRFVSMKEQGLGFMA